MQYATASRCDCCGLAVDLTKAQVCPACQYPVDPAKERAFLETSLYDLRRVASHGGASIRVVDLIRRYEQRLFALANPQARAAAVPLPAQKQEQVAVLPTRPTGARPAAASSSEHVPSPTTGGQTGPVQPATSMRGFSLSSDAIVNILAALGSFLILAGALGFALTTADLRISCGGILLLQVVFGAAGLFAQRRFPQLRAVARLYTLISALLVPLVGLSAYRLVTNGLIAFSPPLLLTLAACYAATVYGLLAVTQRFVPFAYLGVIALLTADLALARTLQLAYWWWPCSAMLLALASLGAVSRPSGSHQIFSEKRAILRMPLIMLMYTVVAAVVLLALFLLSDSFLAPLPEKRLALFFISCLLLLWCALLTWRTGRSELLTVLAYLLLGTLLLSGYVLTLDRASYILLLAVVALGYHALARVADSRYASRALPALALDQLAAGLSFLVLLAASALPFQLFIRATGWENLLLLASPGVFSFAPGAGLPFELLALGLCFLVTLDTSRVRAGQASTPARMAWHWLLLLSGLLLASIYGLLVLLWNVAPLWSFLALSLALLACAVLTRRFVGPAWANPLDVLALGEILFTLCLSPGQTPEVVSALLCGLATVLYIVLLYQRRPWPSLLSAALLLLALPFLLVHPPLVLGIGLLLPVCAGIQRAWFSGSTAVGRRSLFAWTLLGPALVYGLVLAASTLAGSQSVLTDELHLHLSNIYDIAAMGLAWYVAALLARQKLWLAPATLFWLLALVLPSNNFWALSILAAALAILAAGAERRVSLVWALPFYLTALCSSGMVVSTAFLSQHFTALSWILLGFALLAIVLGLLNNHLAVLWLTPVYSTLAILVAGFLLGDLFRPPLVAIAGAGLGVVISRFSPRLRLPQRSQGALRSALPCYAAALSAAVLTGVSGSLGNINRPFYGAVPDVLLLDALCAFVVLRLEQRPRWCWLVAVFASWGVLLMQRLTPLSVLGTGTGLLLASLLSRRLFTDTQERKQGWQRLSWSWPWYAAFLVAMLVFDSWPAVAYPGPVDQFAVQISLAFTGLAVLAMLIERAPELLFIPVAQAAWTLHLLLLGAPAALLTLAYTLLCILIFATQFLWRLRPAAASWLPETSLHNVLSLGGLCLVLLNALNLGALSPEAGWLAQTGVLALVTLSLLIFLYGLTNALATAREPAQTGDEQRRVHRNTRARTVHHWCLYGSGLLLALAACWELLAFRQTRIDVLTLVPASYLIIVAPFLLRDQALPARHIVGQVVSLAGSALLLLPALWLSFNGSTLLPTLVLLAEALVLLALGLVMRLRIFILSSTALVVVGTLRMLFLSVPQSVPILLMVFGSLLVLLATGLILARHRLQEAWGQWE